MRVLGLALAAPLAISAPLGHDASAQSAEAALPATARSFSCGSQGEMRAAIGEESGFLAYVQFSGQPVRVLSPLSPTGEARIEWSDGVRSLTWEPGVHLTWRETKVSSGVACGFDHMGGASGADGAPAAPDHSGHAPGLRT